MRIRSTRLTSISSAGMMRFDPSMLFAGGEIGAWYDPNDISTLFQDSAGLTPVTAPGQIVGRILDKSGRGNHATQPGSTTIRPIYRVDEVGVGYLDFDGVDDWLVTGTITPNSDKIQIFSGIRKLSDAASGTVLEISTNFALATGACALWAPLVGVGNSLTFQNRGSATVTASAFSAYPAPTNNIVIAALGDISGDRTTLRVNGAQLQQYTTDLGTASSYGAYPIYIGRRAGSSAAFAGRNYGIIVRFGSNLSTALVNNTERWFNTKIGAY